MKFDKNLTSVHAYLCADGYVIKNPITQKQKYYKIGFRNTNLILLKDFQKRFYNYFKIEPSLYIGQRCQIGSKKIYEILTKEFGSFDSWEWKMPKLNTGLSKIWLRAYFDCESGVTIESHKNRNIGLDCVNKKGLIQIRDALKKLGIKSKMKYREKQKIYRIYIFGKENIIKFKEKIGFLHPNKKEKIDKAINDYINYIWTFPSNEKECREFVKRILKEKIRIKKPYYARIVSKEECNLTLLSELLKKLYNINCLVHKAINSIGTIYYELNINKKEDIQKLINYKFIGDILNNKG